MWAQCVDLLSANDSVAPLFLNWRIHLIFFYILLNVVIRIINNPISSACHSLHILVFKFSPVIYLTCYLDSSISVQKCCLKHRHTIADISLIHIKKKKSSTITVLLACKSDCRCWCRSWRIETPSSSVSSIVRLLSLTLSLDLLSLSVDISNLPLWSSDTYTIQYNWRVTNNK